VINKNGNALARGCANNFWEAFGDITVTRTRYKDIFLCIEINQRCVRGFHASFNCLRCKDMCLLLTFPNLQRLHECVKCTFCYKNLQEFARLFETRNILRIGNIRKYSKHHHNSERLFCTFLDKNIFTKCKKRLHSPFGMESFSVDNGLVRLLSGSRFLHNTH
jgi:hypothetical protein